MNPKTVTSTVRPIAQRPEGVKTQQRLKRADGPYKSEGTCRRGTRPTNMEQNTRQ